MPTQDDVRRIALAFPGTAEDPDSFSFNVAGKAYVWAWRERLGPRQPRVPSSEVVAIRVAHDSEKETLIEMDPDVFFTEPHYNGYPAILVRLAPIDPGMLEKLLSDGWRIRASKRLQRELEASSG